ncbi:MAG TPA: hypothetical protein EYH44_02635 [Thermoprotei archaeon]|nr:hypothetical protein [Thermoprotei archaeon]
MSWRRSLWILAGLTAVGYITISITTPIPQFIKYENIVYATLYILFTYIAIRWSITPLITLIFFNIGRVSRSIVTSYGEIATLAFAHTPLLIYLLGYGIYVAYLLYRREE